MKDQNPFRPGYPTLSGFGATAIESRAQRLVQMPNAAARSVRQQGFTQQLYNSQGIAIPFLRGLGDDTPTPASAEASAAGRAIATGVAVGLGRGVGLAITVGTFVLLGAAAFFGYRYFKRHSRRRR